MTSDEFQRQHGSGLGNAIVNMEAKRDANPSSYFAPIEKKEFPSPLKKQKPQIRLPKKREPNKTEAEWMEICNDGDQNLIAVLFEPWSLNLPSGTRYTPDVVMIEHADVGIAITCYEVKGPFIHNERSVHAFKEARSAFPWMNFVFAQKRESGWTTTEE